MMRNKIRYIAHMIVSCGIPYHFVPIKLIGSLLAFPILFALRYLYGWFPLVTASSIVLCFILSIVALYVVLTEPADHYPVLILDKIFGLLVTFIAIPFQLKLFVVGFCAFHGVRVVLPFLSKHVFHFDLYRLGNVFYFLLPSLLAGALVNGVLRLIVWIAR